MTGEDDPGGRARAGRGTARAGTSTWPLGARGRSAAPPWLDAAAAPFAQGAGARLARWTAHDVAPGRLVPWLPVAFGVGVILYFSADREPHLWAGLAVTAIAAVLCVAARAKPLAFALTLAATMLGLGFTLATWKAARIAHPVLTAPAFNVSLSGFVERREERERTDRIVIRVHRISGARLDTRLERVRVSVRKGMAPEVASFVELRARLSPPLGPLRPGGYDFARDLYFQRIGATGFVLGAIREAAPPEPPGLWLRAAAAIGSLRDAIDARIRAAVPGDKGAIASALITGKRGAISSSISEAMYVSSLAHVLAISGYHMAVVAGIAFFVFRAGLALIPAVASRYPIKKWAALAALAMASFYLLLSGGAVATQRAYIMTAIVLIGVMFDRPALTLRTICVAALVLLAITPEAIVHPSFQMSFAATLALVAVYERGLPWISAEPGSPLAARIALWGGREIAAVIVASLVAGGATTLFAAYHFHRLAPYGIVANLCAMPAVSIWVMPSGLLGLAMLPFGFDRPFWWLMGEGIGWMISVAAFVTSLPGAVGRIPAFGTAPLLLGTAGLVVLCLLRSPLRWSGAGLVLLCVALAWATSRPDILVSADAGMVAVRDASGTLRVMANRRDAFALREWLAADGDARDAADATLAEGVRCDAEGCVARLSDGRPIALAKTAEAVNEDCETASFVVTARNAPPHCGVPIVDRNAVRAGGAAAARIADGRFVMDWARPQTYRRPWTPQQPAAAQPPVSRPAVAPRDATPRPADLEPEDAPGHASPSVAPE
ncbi:ComEC/Rec2 family competence protein [Pseudorhodoplanes sp.]|uniref:ComEC/Rec2 family competence protein n=1 Tax=Pseudorhodoplanes sp. TaxID=1934341 RepID=UPI00391D845E